MTSRNTPSDSLTFPEAPKPCFSRSRDSAYRCRVRVIHLGLQERRALGSAPPPAVAYPITRTAAPTRRRARSHPDA
ncbi:hypothetical protein GCM10012275_38690 [Longimycelium tulufanense]|uniref:Uncharacterized protein n=1 Tax=Longimycelium tulufanense TaxID=907463 RepID=A0A8J3FV23_9PSEU|nr:hypothetical protein GCM10012275_38690 [Longimycelium tulufanense]